MKRYYTSACGLNLSRLSQGFTMVEVVLVVMIMAIIAVTGLPLLTTSMNHYRLKGATEEVVNAFQYARSSAISTGRQTNVIIGNVSHEIMVKQYTIGADFISGGNQLPETSVETGTYQFMEYPLKKGADYFIDMNSVDRFRGVDIVSSDFNSGSEVFFDSLGNPSHGGTVTLALKGQQMIVTLDALTGKVSVSN